MTIFFFTDFYLYICHKLINIKIMESNRMTIKEFAKHAGITERTVFRRIADGSIKTEKEKGISTKIDITQFHDGYGMLKKGRKTDFHTPSIANLALGLISMKTSEDLKNMNKILRKAFPADPYPCDGSYNFYQAYKKILIWEGVTKSLLPSYTVEQIVKYNKI